MYFHTHNIQYYIISYIYVYAIHYTFSVVYIRYVLCSFAYKIFVHITDYNLLTSYIYTTNPKKKPLPTTVFFFHRI